MVDCVDNFWKIKDHISLIHTLVFMVIMQKCLNNVPCMKIKQYIGNCCKIANKRSTSTIKPFQCWKDDHFSRNVLHAHEYQEHHATDSGDTTRGLLYKLNLNTCKPRSWWHRFYTFIFWLCVYI